MGRPRKKPEYDAEKIMKEYLAVVSDAYIGNGQVSLRSVADEFEITILKARKLLITAGVYTSDTMEEIMDLKELGKTIPEIMELTGLSRASVHSYLPYKKGIYNAEELSLNAARLRRYRKRKAALKALKESPQDMELLWKAITEFEGYLFRTYPKGLKFKYSVKGNEIFVDRKKKAVTRASVVLAYQNALNLGQVSRAKELGTFGASYLYPMFLRFGIIKEI